MTTQERFAEDWGMPLDRVGKLVRLARECGKLNEHYCNGDPHPANTHRPDDKNKNAELWDHAHDLASHDLLRFVETYGFTEVVHTGLGPTLKRGEQFVEIPY